MRHTPPVPACRVLLLASITLAVPAAAQQHDHFRINPALPQAEASRAAMPRRTELGGHVPDLPRGAAAPTNDAPPALNPGLGALTWPAGTTKAEAQAWFDQGYRWAWGFNHAEAARAFRMAQQADPDCAMCWWGEAWVLGPHINFIMEEDANRRALDAIGQAQQRAPQAGEMRAALIEALSRRYSPDAKADRKALDGAFAEAMLRVQARWPADPEVAVLTADALMNLSPWDYWEDAGRRPKGMTARTIELLEGVLGTRPSSITPNPLHPGAIHLYIHTVEASADPGRAAPHAARLAALMPAAGHVVHMPAHIWYRLGRWRDSLEANLAAVAADEAQIARGGASPLYAQGYFAHNVHFVMVSSLMGGDGPRAVEAATRLAALIADEAKRAFPGLTQPVAAAPFVAHARFSTLETILALPAPAEEFPYIRAHWHYARGVALAQSGRADAARQEAAAIGELAQAPAIRALPAQGVPAPEVLGIAQRVVNARIAQAAGDHATAAKLFAEAAAIQDTLPYMEPPFWYYPVHQSLGAALLAQGKPAEAEEAFRQALKRVPNNAWAAAGLLKTAEMRGDAEGAATARGMLQKSWFGGPPPAVERL
ncbi:tetratricopeptide repeat protein [Roseicella aquatilis]|uniref:Tetratricopeptide repeat protein n=1 Tax=Roseicella aquatilis TaxID=2527868 RepID=A0A4R4DA45_9PROT|nr:tetratricopeptide repeat protein [Roseicella aquatilis]TCZ56280.1 tetratricopeptide repeat protein [Roseicella aquatilis]